MSFSKFLIEERRAPIAGIQRIYRFENGYGASVIDEMQYGSRGHTKPKYELAVIRFDGDHFTLNYNTPVTSDVIRYITAEEVETNLRKISKLEKGLY